MASPHRQGVVIDALARLQWPRRRKVSRRGLPGRGAVVRQGESSDSANAAGWHPDGVASTPTMRRSSWLLSA